MNVQSHSQQSTPAYNGSAERSMQNRLLEVLKSHHPKPVSADRLCALAGVRRILLATAMSELITNNKAHLVCADVYGLGPVAPTARSLGTGLDTDKGAAEKACKRCTVPKTRSEFYTGDSTCKSCRKQLAKDRSHGSPVVAETKRNVTADVAPLCKCGAVCQYYGTIGGYSVQCEACNAKAAERRRQRTAKESQPSSPTDSHAEDSQAVEPKAEAESAPAVSHVVAGKESQPQVSTDVALRIPPRKGLDCCVREGAVILTQGDSSIEIDAELCDVVAEWIICAAEDIERLLKERNAAALAKFSVRHKANNKTNGEAK